MNVTDSPMHCPWCNKRLKKYIDEPDVNGVTNWECPNEDCHVLDLRVLSDKELGRRISI